MESYVYFRMRLETCLHWQRGMVMHNIDAGRVCFNRDPLTYKYSYLSKRWLFFHNLNNGIYLYSPFQTMQASPSALMKCEHNVGRLFATCVDFAQIKRPPKLKMPQPILNPPSDADKTLV